MKKFGLVLILVVGAIAVLLTQSRSPQSTTTVVTDASHEGHDHADEAPASSEGLISGKVLETMDAGGYTYVNVDTGKEKVWAAGPITPIEVGSAVAFTTGMEMTEFKSESLGRTFDSIYFVGSFGASGGMARTTAPESGMPPGHPDISGGGPKTGDAGDMDFSDINAAEGGKTIAALHAEKTELVGKEVVVRGKVTKFTPNIMGKNWIHLGDGSASGEAGDLTVTTQATADVGDVLVVRGVLVADKDFGYGYKYSVMIEDASVTVE